MGRKGRLKVTFIITLFLCFLSLASAENVIIESFEDYSNSDELLSVWQMTGDASVGMELRFAADGVVAPIGQSVKYTYNASAGIWGGYIEPNFNGALLDLSLSKKGVQFYLKGDGTSNNIRVRYNSNGDTWTSNPISLLDTTWQIIRVPFVFDDTDENGFYLWDSAGTNTGDEYSFFSSLTEINRFQILLDNPDVSDNQEHSIYLDEIRGVDFFPPNAPIQMLLEDYENIVNTEEFKTIWQAFGYPTRDYTLYQNNKSPEGYRNAYWLYCADETTTWGMAFRTRPTIINNLDISSTKEGGIQFLMKGDGTKNVFVFRFTDTENNYWVSYPISMEDTTWHWAKVPYKVSEESGFRWCGNSPDSTYWGPIIGTEDELMESLTKVNEIRFDIRTPEIDAIYRSLQVDAIYAVSELPPNDPIAVEDFEDYATTDDLTLSWNQFGTGSTSIELGTQNIRSGNNSMTVTYNGHNGYTGIRKRNIIPAMDLSEQGKGIQFWIKGDGSDNDLTFRIYNGDEMWESYKMPLSYTGWNHWSIKFKADSTKGFRYLGNDPNYPSWSSNIGTTTQLYGDLSSVDQIRFYVQTPEDVDKSYSFTIDNIEAVDEFSSNSTYTAIESEKTEIFATDYTLRQNYPNPFNPTTTLEYSLPTSGIVTMSIYNLLGQQIQTLVNQPQNSGKYQVIFDGAGYASGVYFYHLNVKNHDGSSAFSQVNKMVLLK